jgi:tetratricopeptide (TPR) repeat protein
MSNPDSSSLTPKFTAENGYSDIWETSTPPPPQHKPPVGRLSHGDEDFWASGIADNDNATSLDITDLTEALSSQTRTKLRGDKFTTESRLAKPVPTDECEYSMSEVADRALPTLEIRSSTTSAAEYNTSVTGRDFALQYCERGRKSLAAKDYAQARSAYKIAVEWDAQLAIAHSGLARVFTQIQDYENALLEWDLAIAIDRSQLDFYYQRALLSKLVKNYYQVLADCKQILDRDPLHTSARWLNAVALVKTENYRDALFNLDLYIKNYPQDPNGYCYRGICFERLERFNEALADLDRAIALRSHQPVFHHARGRTRQQLGDLAGALADFNITVERKPHAAIYDDRAELHRCLGDHSAALQDCDRAIELNPQLIGAYFRRGLTYTEFGDLNLALVDYNTTIELDPQHLQACIQRSWIYFRQAEYARAKRDCQSAISLDENCFWASYILGVVNSLLGLKNNALVNFTKAIDIFPNYISTRYHRGIIYHELGNLSRATADFQQARSIQAKGLERLVDRDETGFYAEGLALDYLGQPEAARKVLTLGALSAKRFNNPSFQKLIQARIESLG